MKTAIAIPDDLFQRAEEMARRRKMRRSTLYAQAVREFLNRHVCQDVTGQLNAVYAEESGLLDSATMAMQCQSVLDGEW